VFLGEGEYLLCVGFLLLDKLELELFELEFEVLDLLRMGLLCVVLFLNQFPESGVGFIQGLLEFGVVVAGEGFGLGEDVGEFLYVGGGLGDG
jgi:hypothetical protein